MNKGAIERQFRYLRRLKRISEKKLRRHHNETFKGTVFDVKVPKWMSRTVLERRLFYWYCVRNYHYGNTHPITKEFRKRARYVLSEEYLAAVSPEQHAEEVIKEAENFTEEAIEKMRIVEVDRYLASLSLYVEGTEEQRRKVLWEWFNRPLDSHRPFDSNGMKVRRRGRLNNRFRLRDLILKSPSLPYDDFVLAFGDQMPTVSRASYNQQRYLLKKAGYAIPSLPMGPSRPVVSSGPYGQPKRARVLNDIPLERKNHGQEEPF